MTEKQRYDVLRQYTDFELRHYPRAVLVQVEVAGDFAAAGNRGFGPLFQYISGNNQTSTRIAMTAPVIQETTAPQSHTVSFVLPDGMPPADVPVPRNAQVRRREVPERTVAARRFSGSWSEDRFAQNGALLVDAVHREGLRPDGRPYFARFDPPWKPGFLKHNEALVTVSGSPNP
ncbi:heme-binding protein [Cryobacterium sinapicolor]|uniref:Heme-binding protein n=1 Tax=Cryobacterium sinapicolor TaxID=1259236 RepID=A0ABY2JI00_9MICO|nr:MULTISPECIES: heme-binding protein [Cryobacterium]TFC91565.1 heme-binding protein [Cryobacterium sp. TMT3-29-2]TFD05027.1 heme-binding protein [Cryobacterium sinapicolor]